MDDFLLFAGSASRKLGAAIAEYLDQPLAASETHRFSEGNLFVRVLENVRGRHTFLVQGTAFPANDNFMELLFWIDALKRASAASVTAVIPYFSYAKGDKKDEPRVSIRARVCADAIESAGVDRVVTMDLHAPQLQGFFHVPVDDLYAMPILCEAIAAKALPDLVVVAPDAGFAKKARAFAQRLGRRTRSPRSERTDHSETAEVTELIGDVEGKTALIVDDFTISAGSLADAARILADRGAAPIYAMVTPRPDHRDRGRTARGQPDRAALHHRHRRDATGRAARQRRGHLGRRPVRRGDPPDLPPREHQLALRMSASGHRVAHSGVRAFQSSASGDGADLGDERPERLSEVGQQVDPCIPERAVRQYRVRGPGRGTRRLQLVGGDRADATRIVAVGREDGLRELVPRRPRPGW